MLLKILDTAFRRKLIRKIKYKENNLKNNGFYNLLTLKRVE